MKAGGVGHQCIANGHVPKFSKERALPTWLLRFLWSLDMSELLLPFCAMTDRCEV